MKGAISVFLALSLALAAAVPSLLIVPLQQHTQDEHSLEDVSEVEAGKGPVHFNGVGDYSWEEETDDSDDDDNEENEQFSVLEHPLGDLPLVRHRRQARQQAVDLALDHSRNVGRVHGRVNLNGAGQNLRNYHAHGGAGLGSVVYRSRNGRHSVGVGAYAEQSRGRFQGHSYRSRPNVGAGIGYRFRF